jgi:ornithine--oxo-acid transaminase
MQATSYNNLEKQYGANNYKPLDVILCRREGVWVRDVAESILFS